MYLLYNCCNRFAKGSGILLFLFSFFAFTLCRGAITVSSVSVTTSTCPNNGTAIVYASSNNPNASLFYALGPNYSPWHNDSIFTSIYPGSYTAREYAFNSFDSTQESFTITDNSVPPN